MNQKEILNIFFYKCEKLTGVEGPWSQCGSTYGYDGRSTQSVKMVQSQHGVEGLWSQFGLAYGYDGRSKRNFKYFNFSNFFYKCEGKINLKNAS